MNAIECREVSVAYDDHLALWNASFSIPQGSFTGIIGPNGAGKSTLFKAALGILPLSSGSVEFFSSPFHSCPFQIAYVPQKREIDWRFPITVFEVALMGRYPHMGFFKKASKEDIEQTLSILSLVGLLPFKDRQINALSGGQQQRLFLARALLQQAELYMFDEPFTGIDIATEELMIAEMKELIRRGKTVIIVHHDLTKVRELFDHVVILNKSVIASGKTAEVFTKENLHKAYGNQGGLFDEITRLSKAKTEGML